MISLITSNMFVVDFAKAPLLQRRSISCLSPAIKTQPIMTVTTSVVKRYAYLLLFAQLNFGTSIFSPLLRGLAFIWRVGVTLGNIRFDGYREDSHSKVVKLT